MAAGAVSSDEEIGRLDPVLRTLAEDGTTLAVDTYSPETQRFALSRGVAYLNDIRGFPDPAIYPALAFAACRLVVMHAAGGVGRAEPLDLDAGEVWRRIEAFFAERVDSLERSGIARERLILDPGMGLFLSRRPEASVYVLAQIGRLKEMFGLPLMISVSRKSFLGAITGRQSPGERGAATLAAELFAAAHGADYIRTHDPAAVARRADRDGGAGRGRETIVTVKDEPLISAGAGIAAGRAGRRDHRHRAFRLGRRDRQARIDPLGRMDDPVRPVELLPQGLLRTAAAAGRHVLGDDPRWRRGRGLLIRDLRAAWSGIGQRKSGQYWCKKVPAGVGHDRPPAGVFFRNRRRHASGSKATPLGSG